VSGNANALVGCLLGTAVGDALGLPYENLSPRRAARLLGPPDRHRFLLGRGMVSDDTEHTCMVAQALAAAGGEQYAFARDLARRLRWWLVGLPAGVGFATLRAILKLWLGWSPATSGVFSAGNGPAMRGAILGAAVADRDRLRQLVRASTRLTHTDPKAEHGAFAVALAARLVCERPDLDGPTYLAELRGELANAAPLLAWIEKAVASAAAGETTAAFAASQGWQRGVSGYVYHTVPVALHAWLRHPRDYAAAVSGVILAGGDTDTTAAITGGIVGTAVGRDGIPPAWLDRLAEWPRTVGWMERLAVALADGAEPPRLSGLATLGRNAVFFLVVVGHVLRRLLPPY